LKAVVVCAAALAEVSRPIEPADLAFARNGEVDRELAQSPLQTTLANAVTDLERRMITSALAASDNNRSAAARRLGLSRVGLLKMMSRLGLR
jgi:transcriptional regulator with GAF, ATPase, and Fis domain